MDKEELQQKIALYYSKLPPNAQALFASMGWLETLKTISQKYGLSDKQIETLGTETTLALLGIIHLVEYEETLTNELVLPGNSVEKMLTEIEELIFKTIRPQLVLAFESNKKSETEKEPNIEQKFDGRFGKLPKEIENIVEKSNYQAILYSIAKGYNLNVEQMGILETTVTNLIVGTIHPDEFEEYLENNLKIPLEMVKKLVNEINEKIFKKIREELIKNTERKKIFQRDSNTQTFAEVPVIQTKKETAILSGAGIEIIENKETLPVPEKLELMTTEKPVENREDILKKIEKPELITAKEEAHPILAQKLSGSFQIPTAKTDHSLSNLSSSNTPSPVKKVDPYRETLE